MSIGYGVVALVGGAMQQQAASSDARQARNQAAQFRDADKAAADKAAAEGISNPLIRDRRSRQTLLSGTSLETFGGGDQVQRPTSRTLLGYGAQPSMYTPTGT